jgi:hypothetical protein
VSDKNESSPSPSPIPSDNQALVLPAFGKTPELSLRMSSTREAEKRLVEAKTVNPMTYSDLEHCFNESYRELKKHMSTVGYQIAMAEKALETAKSDILLDKYPEFMKDKPKTQDNADLRKAFFMRDAEYVAALDRLAQLKAVESFVDGRIKVMENVCRYMRKQMDLVMRSGLSNADLYVTQGRK